MWYSQCQQIMELNFTEREFKDLVPKKYEIFDKLVIFAENSFRQNYWVDLQENEPERYLNILNAIADCFKVVCVARKTRIPNDDLMRRPKLQFVFASSDLDDTSELRATIKRNRQMVCPIGPDFAYPFFKPFWISVKQYDIIYSFRPTHVMFSAGNITEKERILRSFSPKDKIIVDLFAGIGYFTLAYLKAGAKLVYACEINEFSVEALQRNLLLNKFESDSCIILPGDNRESLSAYRHCADHVNLGLLPTAEMSWRCGVEALNPNTGGWLHVHENILISELEQRIKTITSKFIMLCNESGHENWQVFLRHVEKVKSYAPKVDHYVLDFECRPK